MRACSHVGDGAGEHAGPGASHVGRQVNAGEAIEVVAERQRQQWRQPQQGDHLEPVAADRSVYCLEPRVLLRQLQHPLARCDCDISRA